MKTNAFRLLTLLTLLTFVLYNCTDKDAGSLQPSGTGLTEQIDKLGLNPVTLDVMDDLKVTPGNLEVSAKTKEINDALKSITSANSVPSSVTAAATDVSTSLSASEISAVSNLTPSEAASNSIVNSAEIQKILAKAAVDPELKTYLPQLSLTVIEGMKDYGKAGSGAKPYNARKTSAGQDECVTKANEKFNEAKERIEAGKTKELEKITDAYNKDLEKISKNYTKCIGDNGPQYFNNLRQIGIAVANQALAALEKAKPYLRAGQYESMKVLINIQLLDYLDKVNKLELEKIGSCTRISELAKEYALAVRDANITKVEAAYKEALEKAEEILEKMIAACHNQGSGS